MKKIFRILYALLMFTQASYAATYYVATDGTGDFSSLSALSAITLVAGDKVYFRRGDVFRGGLAVNLEPGAAGNPIYFGAYGTGAKPKFLGSTDLSATSAWTVYSGNVWVTAAMTTDDVGILVFNYERGFGTKYRYLSEVVKQGDFFFNYSEKKLYLYSASNPGAYYQHIEAGMRNQSVGGNGELITFGSYQTWENIDVRYFASHGMNGGGKNNVIIRNCDFSWGGGAVLTWPTRYGNALQFWSSATDCLVDNCTFYQIYDQGHCNEGGTAANHVRITYTNNLVIKCWQGCAIKGTDITFNQNTVAYSSDCWSANQRSSGFGAEGPARGMYFGETTGTQTLKNNIFIDDGENQHSTLLEFYSGVVFANMDIDYNCYYAADKTAFMHNSIDYTTDDFVAWKTLTGQDAHSICSNPLLTGDYYLREGSPCIGAGTEL